VGVEAATFQVAPHLPSPRGEGKARWRLSEHLVVDLRGRGQRPWLKPPRCHCASSFRRGGSGGGLRLRPERGETLGHRAAACGAHNRADERQDGVFGAFGSLLRLPPMRVRAEIGAPSVAPCLSAPSPARRELRPDAGARASMPCPGAGSRRQRVAGQRARTPSATLARRLVRSAGAGTVALADSEKPEQPDRVFAHLRLDCSTAVRHLRQRAKRPCGGGDEIADAADVEDQPSSSTSSTTP